MTTSRAGNTIMKRLRLEPNAPAPIGTGSPGCGHLLAGRPGSPLPGAGFTLIEMMVVLGIIAVVIGIALPNLRGLREGSEIESAARQLIQDLSLARGRAINGRTTVAVIFIPWSILKVDLSGYPPDAVAAIKALQAGPYTQYALYSGRRVGDQPGQSTPRYLTEWRTLPDKTFIATNKFTSATSTNRFLYADFPFPFATNQTMRLPYVAFNYEGHLCRADGGILIPPGNARIPLARGAILYVRDATGGVPDTSFSVQEVPPGNSQSMSNQVVIDWLTGRARLQRAEIQSVQ
jgi:prepilin-type N-terminal cleavage/methylation domain-containing protein